MNNFEGSFNSHISDSQQDAGQLINSPPENRFIKDLEVTGAKIALGVATVGVGMGFAACAPVEAVEPTSVIETTTIPTISPVMEIASVETSADFKIFTKDNIEGLTLKDGIYYYDSDNQYGGKEGNIAGTYKEDIYNNGTKVGGVCLDENVCYDILRNDLRNMSKDEKKIKVILPLDITEYEGNFKVELCGGDEYNWYACFFDGKLAFVDNYPENSVYATTSSANDSFMVTKDDDIVNMTQLIINLNCFRDNNIMSYKDLSNVFYFFSNEPLEYGTKYESTFGQSLCQVDNSLLICLGERDTNGDFNSIKMPDNSLLALNDGSLVFIKRSSGFIFFDQDFQKEE